MNWLKLHYDLKDMKNGYNFERGSRNIPISIYLSNLTLVTDSGFSFFFHFSSFLSYEVYLFEYVLVWVTPLPSLASILVFI